MNKLRYYFGCMGSMKSATLVMKAHNFRERGYKPIIMKPLYDTRDVGIIKPRPMKGVKVDISFAPEDNLYRKIVKEQCDNSLDTRKRVIFVDEIQFATSEHMKQLWEIAHFQNIDVYCYGLRISYLNEVFEPVRTLEVFADTQEEIKTGCKHCVNKATTHILYIDNIPVIEGTESLVGDFEGRIRYESVCQECRRKIMGDK